MLARVRTHCNRRVFAVLRGDARSPWRAGTSQRLGGELQMGTKHRTSGVLSGPLTGSLLHSLNVNLGALEKSEKARNLIFVCRALSAKASLPAVAPRRSAFQWPDRALAHGVPGGRLRRWSPTRACHAASSGTSSCDSGANACVTCRRLRAAAPTSSWRSRTVTSMARLGCAPQLRAASASSRALSRRCRCSPLLRCVEKRRQ